MTPKQRRFALVYVKHGGNAAAAAREVGTTAMTAGKWLKKDDVRMLVELEQQAILDRAGMSAEDVLEELARVARAYAPIRGGEKVKALELLGKRLKLWEDKADASTTPLVVNFTVQR